MNAVYERIAANKRPVDWDAYLRLVYANPLKKPAEPSDPDTPRAQEEAQTC